MSGLLDWLASSPDGALVIEDGAGAWTAGGLRTQVGRLAGALRTIEPGARFAVHSRNRAEIVAAYLAARWTGTVMVPVNHHLRPAELAWQLDDADVRAVWCSAASAAALAPLREGRGDRTVWWCFDDGVEGFPQAPESPPGPPSRGGAAPMVQMYTSGTTGRPKGAVLSEDNLVALVESWAEHVPLDPACRTLQVTPLFHVGGLTQSLSNLRGGGTLVLPVEFQPNTALRALREGGVTHALLVPAMMRWILLEAGPDPAPFPDLRVLIYGGAPLPPALAAMARPVFACGWYQGYGLTETTGVSTILLPTDHDRPELLTSAGRPLSCCEVRVVGPDDGDVEVGEVGEVVVRGTNVSPGYHHRPEANVESWRGGWFHTGDAGRFDRDGYLFLVDRVKDMILVGGENVYSREVEAVMEAHPSVREVAVVGVPHEVWGEAVMAFVVPSEPDPDPALGQRLIRHAREGLARYKCPTEVRMVAALPRNAAGKVRKNELRDPFWQGRERRI